MLLALLMSMPMNWPPFNAVPPAYVVMRAPGEDSNNRRARRREASLSRHA